jgi:hypothetical protein
MAQVKVYAARAHLAENRASISDIIHSALVGELGLPKDKRFQRFIPMDAEDFLFPSDRSSKYTIIEISMFEGRSEERIKALLKRIMAEMEGRLGMHANDTEITVFQSPKHCWGIRGKTGDELALNYKVDV